MELLAAAQLLLQLKADGLALSTPISHFLSGFDNCHRFSCPASCTSTSDDCLRESNLVISKHAHLAKGP